MEQLQGLIADIQTYSVNDGPGIRTTVFVKGCPLRCKWCHNPEMISPRKEVWYKATLCTLCGKCIDVCPESAIKGYRDYRVIDRDACTACMKCVEVCPNQAMCSIGRDVAVSEVLAEIRKSAVFYRRGTGGATVSGGEPSLQPHFTTELLRQCQDHLIHTALDTCGLTSWDTLRQVAQYADLVLFDVKHLDPARHAWATGVSNEPILENLAALAKIRRSIHIRVPVIAGFNDSEDHLRGVAELAARNGVEDVDLLPYHSYAESKYRMLGKEYELGEAQSPTEERMESLKALVASYGLTVSVGG